MVTKPNQSKPVMYGGLPKGPYPFFSRLNGELEDNIRSHESGFSYLGELGSEILLVAHVNLNFLLSRDK